MIPDKFTFVPVINACANLQSLEEGRYLHTQIIQNGCESDPYVGSLIHMYAKCGSIEDAWRFNNMFTRDVVLWNAMILGQVKCGPGQNAFQLYQQMQFERLEPDAITYVGVLNACASLGTLMKGGMFIISFVHIGFKSNVFVVSSLIDMYAKCGSTEDAWKVFNETPIRNMVSWSAMIVGYVRCGHGQKALELSQQMHQDGVEPDSMTFVGIFNACASVAALEEGRCVHTSRLSMWLVASLTCMPTVGV
jgi:pentatricopeptide repeat protein